VHRFTVVGLYAISTFSVMCDKVFLNGLFFKKRSDPKDNPTLHPVLVLASIYTVWLHYKLDTLSFNILDISQRCMITAVPSQYKRNVYFCIGIYIYTLDLAAVLYKRPRGEDSRIIIADIRY